MNDGQQRKPGAAWDAQRIRALRLHLRYTQRELAEALGARQQTISEWETGLYRPRGTAARLLSIIAERAEFAYEASGEEPSNHG
jgi:DNA-binding transcriptional regulator YiaG